MAAHDGSLFERNPKKTLAAFCLLLLAAVELFGQGYYRLRHETWLYPDKRPEARFTPYGLLELVPESGRHGLRVDVNGFIHNGYDRPISADRDKVLIFMLGGSTVYGWGASSNAATVAAQLEKELDRLRPGCCRVVNAGLTAFTAYRQLALIEGRLTQEFEPDVVIALDGRNDGFNAANFPYWKPNWSEEYDLIKRDVNRMMEPPLSAGLLYWLPRVSSIAHYLDVFAYNYRAARADPTTPMTAPASPAVVDRAVGSYLINHEVAHLRLSRRGIPYFAFLQPTLLPSLRRSMSPEEKDLMAAFLKRFYRRDDIYWRPMERFFALAASEGPRREWYLDLSRLFDRVPQRMYADSCHYTDEGNRLLARRIAEVLRAKDALRKRPDRVRASR